MLTVSSMQKDFIASHLRGQLVRLRAILEAIESEDNADCEYANESLKVVEVNLRQIRKLCKSEF